MCVERKAAPESWVSGERGITSNHSPHRQLIWGGDAQGRMRRDRGNFQYELDQQKRLRKQQQNEQQRREQ